MAMERIPVRKIKETLRLRHACKLSQREVAGAVRVAPSTVSDYLKRAKAAGLSWPLPEGLDDDALERLLFVQPEHPAGKVVPVPDWREVSRPTQNVRRTPIWNVPCSTMVVSCDDTDGGARLRRFLVAGAEPALA